MHYQRPGLHLLFALALLGLLAAAPAAAAPARLVQPSPARVSQLIIALKPAADQAARNAVQRAPVLATLSAQAGVQLSYARAMSGGAHVLRLPGPLPVAQAQQLAARLSAGPNVLYAEPDYINHPLETPTDPLFNQQWDLQPDSAWGANLEAAWDYTTGDPDLAIAIIDTGVRPEHPDLAGRFVPGIGYDFLSTIFMANDGDGRDADPSDAGDWVNPNECGDGDPSFYSSSWHGTHVAGTIAASAKNGTGMAGINWQSKLLILRALGKCGGTDSDITDAIRWAAGIAVPGVPANSHPARVINMSLGGNLSFCPQAYQRAINDVVALGVVVVVAAGNASQSVNNATPANCNNVISVGATTRQGTRAYYSNYGAKVDLSAPGGQTLQSDFDGILSTLNSGTTTPSSSTYGYYQGTSMAAPHVAGVASLMLSLEPSLTPAQVEALLKDNVTAFPAAGCDAGSGNCGTGILNAAKALAAIRVPPSLDGASPPNGAVALPYAYQFAVGGQPKPTVTLVSGELPPGLALSDTGLLAGVPSAEGVWEFTLRASNGVGTPATQVVQLTIETRQLFYTPVVASFS